MNVMGGDDNKINDQTTVRSKGRKKEVNDGK